MSTETALPIIEPAARWLEYLQEIRKLAGSTDEFASLQLDVEQHRMSEPTFKWKAYCSKLGGFGNASASAAEAVASLAELGKAHLREQIVKLRKEADEMEQALNSEKPTESAS